MNTLTAEFEVTFRWDEKLPNVLSIEGPRGMVDDVYFDEHEGLQAQFWMPRSLVPEGGKLESNGKNEAWISHHDETVLKQLDGKTFRVRYSLVEDEDGEVESEESEVLS